MLDAPAVGLLDGVLLDEHPAVAAVPEGAHELVRDVGVVGQRHLRRREAAHSSQRLEAEDGREVMLPGADVQAVVLHRGRGRDGVAPRASKPFDRPAIARVQGDRAQRVEHVVRTHLAQPVQKRARVLEHHARLRALVDELRDELPHPLVAPAEHRSIVVVPDVRVLGHVAKVADEACRPQIVSAGRDQRLVHVQRDRERAVDSRERIPGARVREHRTLRGVRDRRGDQRLATREVGQPVDVLGQLVLPGERCVAHLCLMWS